MFNDIYNGRKVLVTGHTGFKGSWLVAWLQLLGAEVVGVALEPDTEPSHYKLLHLDFASHTADIRDAEKITQIIRQTQPEIVLHLAAQPLVRDSYVDPLSTFATNTLGTANVLNACRNLDDLKAVVVVTSDKCYENKEWERGYCEYDPMGGYDPYSASKGCAELVTASFRNSFFNLKDFNHTHQTLIASARAGNVIGGGDWAKDRLIPDAMRAVAANAKVQIRNPNSTRPWQHVLESLSGYLCLGEKLLKGKKEFAEGWNFAPDITEQAAVIDVLTKMQAIWPKVQFEIITQKNQPHEARLLQLDSSKAQNLLQWRSVWNFDQTINATITWYQRFYAERELSTFDNIEHYANNARSLNYSWSL